VETSRYLINITILRKAIAKVLTAKYAASLQLLRTVSGNQARLDARTEFEILERSPKGTQAGRARDSSLLSLGNKTRPYGYRTRYTAPRRVRWLACFINFPLNCKTSLAKRPCRRACANHRRGQDAVSTFLKVKLARYGL